MIKKSPKGKRFGTREVDRRGMSTLSRFSPAISHGGEQDPVAQNSESVPERLKAINLQNP